MGDDAESSRHGRRCQVCDTAVQPNQSDRMVRLLGPIDVTDGGASVPIGGALQRATLAILLTRRTQPVGAEFIADALYGDTATCRSPLRIVHTYVSNLRRLLGDVIVSIPGGYRFDSERLTVDADRFAALARAARNLRGEDPERSVQLLEAALALWRSDPYGGFENIEVLRPEIVRLEEQRLEVIALHNRIRLDLGFHHEALPDLAAAVAAHPYRENLVALLMDALHQDGAPGEARRVYGDTAQLLWDEFGVLPSTVLEEAASRLDATLPAGGREGPRLSRQTGTLRVDGVP